MDIPKFFALEPNQPKKNKIKPQKITHIQEGNQGSKTQNKIKIKPKK